MEQATARTRKPAGRTLIVILLAVSLLVPAFVAAAQSDSSWTQQAKLIASDGESKDRMGWDTVLDGDTALLSAVAEDNANGQDAGAVYVFTRSASGAWIEQDKLVASDGEAGDRFGKQVDLDGDTAIVGATGGPGAAYIFERDTEGNWNENAKLTASDGVSGDVFGFSVGLDGDTALVAAKGDDNANGIEAGSVYVFTRDDTGAWNEQTKLLASDGADEDRLGRGGLTLEGDTALIGAVFDDNGNGGNAGAVYVFTGSGASWTEQAKLTASDGQAEDWFGAGISLQGDTALVGAMKEDNDNGQDAGAVYVFERSGSTWTESTKFVAGDGAEADRFGQSVSLDQDRALVGAPKDDLPDGTGGNAGAAYVFERNDVGSWTQQAKLTADDREALDNLGAGLDLEGDRALIGAFAEDNIYGEDAGAAYVFVDSTVEEQAEDETQNDAGTGGDASDDPEDPTPLSGGEVIHINGTLVVGSDEVDAYGTSISADTTESMRFNFTAPRGMPLNVTLIDPADRVVATDETPITGGNAIVEADAGASHLEAGEWTTVLRLASSSETSGLLPSGAVPVFSLPTGVVGDTGVSEDGAVPGVVPDGFTFVDYRDERRCDPKC